MRGRELALLAALIFLAFWSGSASTPLFDLDEGAFSQATLEMLDSGNWLTTTLEGQPRYDKPMLTYWLQGLAVKLLGQHEFAFRLHSMLAASLWLLLVFAFVRAREPRADAAWLAAGSLGLSLMPGLVGHAATADALLNLLLAAALLDLYRYYEQPRRGTAVRVFLWMGLGVLTKGPVAVIIPAAVSFLFFLWQGRLRDWFGGVLEWRGWLLLLAVVLPWGILCWQADNGEWIRRFLFEHNLERYSTTLQGHGGKLYYYVLALPLIVLPFTSLLPGALGRTLGGDALDRYCLLWFGFVFVVFSFSKTQLPHYLLYGATPLFILFGRQCARLPARPWLLAPGLLFMAVLVALPWLLPLVEVKPGRAWEAGLLAEAQRAFGGRYFLVAGIAAALALWACLRPPPQALLTLATAQALLLWFGLMPVVAAAHQLPTRAAALHARALGGTVVSYGTFLPTFSVYRGAVTPRRPPQPGELAFLRADRLERLQREIAPAQVVIEFRQGGVLLVRRLP